MVPSLSWDPGIASGCPDDDTLRRPSLNTTGDSRGEPSPIGFGASLCSLSIFVLSFTLGLWPSSCDLSVALVARSRLSAPGEYVIGDSRSEPSPSTGN